MAAIEKEALLQSGYLAEQPIQTLYFGGGTPSLLPIPELQRLFDCLHANYPIAADAEITLEANPDDITTQKLDAWRQMGINRLSIGIQSFSDKDLQWMNRAHTANQATNCIALAQSAGFDNITIDLIYGTPVLTDEAWKENVDKALSFGIRHLSCYALTVEPKTGLEKMIAKKQVEAVDADKQAHHFTLLMQWLSEAGFEHYEISNFAQPGSRSKHNSNYWQGAHYLGLGPSAHSFNGHSRQWNIANNSLYIQNLNQDILPFEIEQLSPLQQLNEYIMTSIRTMEGLSLQHVGSNWGNDKAATIETNSAKAIGQGYVIAKENFLVLSNAGKLMADGIASDLFFV